jgi:hypothetical protein
MCQVEAMLRNLNPSVRDLVLRISSEKEALQREFQMRVRTRVPSLRSLRLD